ncbi:MAG: type II toxin-antitoxin system VapC family toxin [Acidobacteria bacterium]|nr:type II toxin-antitoxin system VapC family toxin [Acidobacteriota bacterium]
MRFWRLLEAFGVPRNDSMPRELCHQAALWKAEFRRISIADCIGLAVAEQLGAAFLTAGHHELDELAATGRFDNRFIR